MRPLLRATGFLLVTALVAACSSGGGELERAVDERTTTTTQAPATTATGEDEQPPASGPILRIGLAGPMTLDPAAISPASVSSVMLVDLVHDTLTRIDGQGVPQPQLAEFTTNEDHTLWRFQLRDRATFVDGSPIGADDVVTSIDRVRQQGGASLAAIQLEDVRSVTAVDPRTVDIVLAEPSTVLPELLSAPAYGIVDAEALPTAVGAPLNPSGAHAVEATASDRLVLERRRGDGPAIIELRLFPDDAAAYDSFRAGELDWAPVPVDQLGEASTDLGLEGVVPFHGTVLLGVNAAASPLDQLAMRRAIALAVDRSTLTDAVFGPTAQPLAGLVPAGVPGAAAECRGPCGPDVAQARELVASVFPGGEVPPLRLLTDESATHAAIAGVLVEQLAAAGLTVTPQPSPAGTYAEQLAAGQTELYLHSSLGVARSPATHLLPWASTSPDNVTGYRNDLVDAAIALARTEPDAERRHARWQEIELAVLQDVPVVPLAQLRTVAALSDRIEGLTVHADGSIDVAGVTFPDADDG